MLSLEFSIAMRYLKAKRKDGFASLVSVFSFIGIMLGVATLIVTMAVMNGVKTELINRIIGINAHISVSSFNGQIANYETLVEDIKKIEGIKTVNAAIHGQVLASVGDNNVGLLFRGLKKEDLISKELVANSIIAGDIYEDKSFQVIAGVNLARNIGVRINDDVKLLSPKFNSTVFGAVPRMKDFNVVGIFDVGMYEYDSSVIFGSLEDAQKFFNLKDKANTLEIRVVDPKNLFEIKSQILELISNTDLYLNDWEQSNSGFIESINVQSNVLFLILALIILVAAFNVISGMVMLVRDKAKEIAILRTIGMSKASIVRIFIICGFSIGFVGTVLGVLLGVLFATNIEEIRLWLESISGTNLFAAEIYFLSQLPAEIKSDDLINITSLALFLSFLSTIYPSYKAANTDPAEALKYE